MRTYQKILSFPTHTSSLDFSYSGQKRHLGGLVFPMRIQLQASMSKLSTDFPWYWAHFLLIWQAHFGRLIHILMEQYVPSLLLQVNISGLVHVSLALSTNLSTKFLWKKLEPFFKLEYRVGAKGAFLLEEL